MTQKSNSNLLEETRLEPLITEAQIAQKIAEVAKVLDRDYADKEITIVMIMKGALLLVSDLIRCIHAPCSIEFVQASSYGKRGTLRGELTVLGLDNIDLSGKHLLVVDDIFDSGHTMVEVLARLKEKHPKSLKSLVLLLKNVPRTTTYLPDYVLFEIENRFVVGYGLDYKEHYRGLPGIFTLVMEQSTS